VYFRIVAFAQALHDVRIQASQVHAGNGADRAFLGHCAREPMPGNAHTHAALEDGKQLAPTNGEQGERSLNHEINRAVQHNLAYFVQKSFDQGQARERVERDR
jgi:hypothetical protein